MSVSSLLDHTCRIYRRTESLSTLRETVVIYEVLDGYDDLPCFFTRRRTVMGDSGAGLQPVGQRTVFLDRLDLTYQDRDIVEVFAGPAGFSGPQRLEVVSRSMPRGNHVELIVQEWNGILNTGPVITTDTPLPDVDFDAPYSVTLEATGGDGEYTWSIVDGSLPLGLTLDADTGIISGSTVSTGLSTFEVQVESAGVLVTKDFTVLVDDAPVVLGSFNLDFNDDFDVGG